MVKSALISRHIVNYKSRLPLYGIILIENEEISDVIIVDDNIPASALFSKFQEWNPINYENYYISPGIIEIGVRPEWETYINITKMAASGGVTLLLEEKSIHTENTNPIDELYCDIGLIKRIDSNNLEDIKKLKKSNAFAFKGYLYPPSDKVASMPNDLPWLLSKVRDTGKPLIIDPSIPQGRMLHMASPCRHMNLEERITADITKDMEFSAAAFPESIYPDEEGSPNEEPVRWNLNRTRSGIPTFSSSRNSSKIAEPVRCSNKFDLNNHLPDIEEEDSMRSRGRTIMRDIKKRRQSSYHDIYEDLDYRIKAIESDIQAISKAEITTYQTAGSTVYSKQLARRRSSSFSDFSFREFLQAVPQDEAPQPAPVSSIQKRLKGKRPMPLNTHMEITIQKDRIYLNHVANIPDKWELKGVKKILEVLQAESCKVHICNLSSAAAVNKIRQNKSSNETTVTCDTCPHYMSFSDKDIQDGDTKFKDYPPIRNQANCNLLWELLKLKGIDIISSHHASIPSEYKNLDNGSFRKALSGINGLGFAMQMVWTALTSVNANDSLKEHYIVRLAKWFSMHPAKLLGIENKRGSIERGKYADLIIWNPYQSVSCHSYSAMKESCIYEGRELMGQIIKVLVRGMEVFDNGNFQAYGEYLKQNNHNN